MLYGSSKEVYPGNAPEIWNWGVWSSLRTISESSHLLHYNTNQEEIWGCSIKQPREVVSQVQIKLLSSTYGWPLKHFSTPGKLLWVLQGVIQGKHHLWSLCIIWSNYISRPQVSLCKWSSASGHKPWKYHYWMAAWVSDNHYVFQGMSDWFRPCQSWRKDPRYFSPKGGTTSSVGYGCSGVAVYLGLYHSYCDHEARGCSQISGSGRYCLVSIWTPTKFQIIHISYTYSADAIRHAVKFGYLPVDGILSCKTLNWEQVQRCVIYSWQFTKHLD